MSALSILKSKTASTNSSARPGQPCTPAMIFSFLSKDENCSNKYIIFEAAEVAGFGRITSPSEMAGREMRKLLKLLYLLISVWWRRVPLATLDCYRKYSASAVRQLYVTKSSTNSDAG
jgi:hypothetical protein